MVKTYTIQIDYWPNGIIKKWITYKNNLKNGVESEYGEEYGDLRKEIPYVDGEITGILKIYWPSTVNMEPGPISQEISYKSGQKHGIFKDNFRNGIIATIRLFNEGIPDGIHVHYDHMGFMTFREFHKNGEITKIEWYHKNGIISDLICYENENLSGEITQYYDSGVIKRIQSYRNGARVKSSMQDNDGRAKISDGKF